MSANAQESMILQGRTEPPYIAPRVMDLYKALPVTGAYISGDGAVFSIAPVGGHVAGDTNRAQEYIKFNTQTGFTQQENGIFVDSVNNKGGVNSWKASTFYPPGSYVHDAAHTQTYHTTAGGTISTSGGPTCTSGSCVHGAITWDWVSAGLNDCK